MPRRLRNYATVALAALLIGALAWYAIQPLPIEADAGVATRERLEVSIVEDGKTRIREKYVLSAPVSGFLRRIELHAGDEVRVNQTALVLEPADPVLLDVPARAEAEARVKAREAGEQDARARLDRAREAHELTKHLYERALALRPSRGIAPEEVEALEHRERIAEMERRSAEFALQVAVFETAMARAVLRRGEPRPPGKNDPNRFEIAAPVDGKVLRVFQESAGFVSAGTKLLEVGDPSDLEVEVDLLTQDAVRVKPGAKAFLEHWGGAVPLPARVRIVEPSGFTKVSALGVEEQRVNAILDVMANGAARSPLGDSFRVEARIMVWEKDHTLQAPAGAFFRHGDGWAAFVPTSRRATLRSVVLGKSNGLRTEVVDGLTEGEPVLVYPNDKIRDGSTIRIR